MKKNYYEIWKSNSNLVPLSRELSIQEFSDNTEETLFKHLALFNSDIAWNNYLYSIINRGLLFDAKSWTGFADVFYLNENYYALKAKFKEKISQFEYSTAYTEYYKAIELFCEGKTNNSLELFSTLVNKDNFDLYGWDIGARTCKPYHNKDMAEATFQYDLAPLNFVFDNRIETLNPTILVTCDKRYYQAFHENIISSVIQSANCPTNIHFHIVDPDYVEYESYLFKDSYDNVGTSVSIENTPIRDKAYFASVRFIRANEIIKMLNDSILIMDADAYINEKLQPLYDYLEGYDIGVFDTRGPWGMVPWRKYWAGCMYISNNKPGYQFADVLRNAHFYLWDYQRPNWWIDQNAIFYAIHFINQNAGKFKTQQLRDFKDITGSYFPIKTGESYKRKTLAEFDK
ncbi:hypothetical protein [Paraglaciecola sp.]|uniref:hypothetical protein n=1 Tax=Paraglaciecola sp. TaxID=1920173 RepID=UPI0032664F53